MMDDIVITIAIRSVYLVAERRVVDDRDPEFWQVVDHATGQLRPGVVITGVDYTSPRWKSNEPLRR